MTVEKHFPDKQDINKPLNWWQTIDVYGIDKEVAITAASLTAEISTVEKKLSNRLNASVAYAASCAPPHFKLGPKGRPQNFEAKWNVYILECADGSWYTGVAMNVLERLRKHNAGLGSKYVASHRPARLVMSVEGFEKPAALKLEVQLKRLRTHKEKADLLTQYPNVTIH